MRATANQVHRHRWRLNQTLTECDVAQQAAGQKQRKDKTEGQDMVLVTAVDAAMLQLPEILPTLSGRNGGHVRMRAGALCPPVVEPTIVH